MGPDAPFCSGASYRDLPQTGEWNLLRRRLLPLLERAMSQRLSRTGVTRAIIGACFATITFATALFTFAHHIAG